MVTKFLLEDRNIEVSPANDFYEYAVGGWIRNNSIPDDYSRWGSFDQLIEDNLFKLRRILENENEVGENKSVAEKLNKFYKLGMGAERINEQGHFPLNPYLEKINKVSNQEELFKVIAEFHKFDIKAFFNFFSTPDSKNSEWVIAGIAQGGMSLPEKDYYFSKENKMEDVRESFLKHVEKMFDLCGFVDAKEMSKKILNIETEIAKNSRTKVELRDPEKNYNKMSFKELKEISPNYNWDIYFSILNLESTNQIDVGQPEFVEGIGEVLNQFDLEDLKIYLAWHLILSSADYLGDKFVEEKFDFYGRILQGQPKIKDRWKRVVGVLDQFLGQAVGKIYVSKYFPEQARDKAINLTKNIILAMGDRIKELSWMGEATKKEALKKLEAIKIKVGYPDWWIDYSSLEISDGSFLQAVLSVKQFEFERDVKKIGKKVNHEEWFIPPQMVNAFYNPLDNEIVFPAGILQPPFFFQDCDEAVNYGGIGVVIGHEITHGFDDQGRKYDSNGNLRDWWTIEDERNFNKRAEKLVGQYESCAVHGVNVNGRLTLGENIADLGGVTVAFDAMQKALKGKGVDLIDGLNQKERFFLSFAQFFKTNSRKERALLLLKIDPHSPDKYRVNIPLSNTRAFHETFKVNSGDHMYRKVDDQVQIW